MMTAVDDGPNPDTTNTDPSNNVAVMELKTAPKKCCCKLNGLKAGELKGWKKVLYKIALLAPIAILSAGLAVAFTLAFPVTGIAAVVLLGAGAAAGTFGGSMISMGIELFIRKALFKEGDDTLNIKDVVKERMLTAVKCTIAAFVGGIICGGVNGALMSAWGSPTIITAAQTALNMLLSGGGAALGAATTMMGLRALVGGSMKLAGKEKFTPEAFALTKKGFLNDIKSGLLIGGAGEAICAVQVVSSAIITSAILVTAGQGVSEVTATLVKVIKRRTAEIKKYKKSLNHRTQKCRKGQLNFVTSTHSKEAYYLQTIFSNQLKSTCIANNKHMRDLRNAYTAWEAELKRLHGCVETREKTIELTTIKRRESNLDKGSPNTVTDIKVSALAIETKTNCEHTMVDIPLG